MTLSTPGHSREASSLNLDELRSLLQLLEEKEISEFEIEQEGMKLRIRKAVPGAGDTAPAVMVPTVVSGIPGYPAPTAPAPAAPAPAAPSPAPASAPAPAPAEEGLAVVKSPIVGTFYRAPDPNSPMFVNVGDRVKQGQVLCIIEAMKLMNEIEAEIAGEVVKIHPDNGQPVQFGDPIFTIRPER
jgi:acetyl-CoA carboxylase biotin carboxyl carrier protein